MGNIFLNTFNNLYWGGDPDEKNSVSGMSLRDIHNVQKSWKAIYADAIGNGSLIFSRLFDAEPEAQRFFKQIATASKAEIANSTPFKAHIINLMSSLNQAIQNLHQPEIVVAMMHKLGNTHKRFSIQERHFWVLKDVIVNILVNDLKLPDNVVGSWGAFVAFMYQNIFTTLH